MSIHSHPSPAVCFYFQVHQPYRLRDLRVTDIGETDEAVFDDVLNRKVFRKVAEKCYLPANALLLRMLNANPDFRIAYSLSGVFLDQCCEYGQDVLESFQALAKTGQVEFLGETYYHSLAALFSLREFAAQVRKHSDAIVELFGQTPKVFRNTELIYSNEIAEVVRLLGFKGILAEGADHVLRGRTPTVPYVAPRFTVPRSWQLTLARERVASKPAQSILTLLKHYKLSDDIAFRFSNKSWEEHPLTSERFAEWVRSTGGFSTNLFMDYETFGEHQWADSGIFQFLEALPNAFKNSGIVTRTPSETIKAWGKRQTETLDAHVPFSWADIERDLSAWRGNHLQEAAIHGIYALESAVRESESSELLDMWRRLQTSDHFYYLCTKYWADGDVHKYFSPYESPYEAYRRFSHALEDLRHRLGIASHS